MKRKMQRNKISKFIFLSVLSLILSLALTSQAHMQFDHLKINRFTLSPEPSQTLMAPINWQPSGNNVNLMTSDCLPESIEKILQEKKSSESEKADLLNQFLQKCERTLNIGNFDGMGALAQVGTVQYRVEQNPNIRRVKINLSSGIALTGFMGLKDDQVKRPFVIVQCGALCGIDDSMSHNLIMQIFEESPFNMLILSNITSTDFARDNGVVRFGGLEEGLGLVELSQMITAKNSSIRDIIDSVHIIGQSLGGHSALFSSLFASSLKNNRISSVMAICPVVDLEASYAHLQNAEGLVKLLIRRQFLSTFEITQETNPTIKAAMQVEDSTFQEKMQFISRAYFANLQQRIKSGLKLPPPFTDVSLHTIEDFWYLSNINHHTDLIKIPTLLLAAKNDIVVPYPSNSGALATTLNTRPNPLIGVSVTETGSHCAQSITLGWPTISRMIKAHILSHSPQFQEKLKPKRIDISQLELKGKIRYENLLNIKWLSKVGSNSMKLSIQSAALFQDCQNAINKNATHLCENKAQMEIPIESLAKELVTPQTIDEARRNMRWANANIRILDQNGHSIFASQQAPFYLEIANIKTPNKKKKP